MNTLTGTRSLLAGAGTLGAPVADALAAHGAPISGAADQTTTADPSGPQIGASAPDPYDYGTCCECWRTVRRDPSSPAPWGHVAPRAFSPVYGSAACPLADPSDPYARPDAYAALPGAYVVAVAGITYEVESAVSAGDAVRQIHEAYPHLRGHIFMWNYAVLDAEGDVWDGAQVRTRKSYEAARVAARTARHAASHRGE